MDKLHEDSRRQFERYFDDFYGCHPTDHHDPMHVEGVWHAWQASRAAIVVEPSNSPEIPDGWVMVPKEPTQKMVIHGFESDAMDALADAANESNGWPYSCRESAELVAGIFQAMLVAAPKQEK